MRIHRLAALVAVTLLAAGCGTPGGDSGDNADKAKESNANAAKVDVAKAGDVTLTVWDQEVRGGQAKQIKRLNQAFQEKYPNVTIKRVAKSFTDLNTTLKLAVSGPKAPDVVEANQGRPVMGQLVKGGLLRPMDAYADAYGWEDRWSKTLLDLNRFSSDGKEFGSGNLYGVSQMGEIVGVYYDKDKVASVPKTFGEFEQMLAKAKQDGDVPISFGNLDKFGGIHEYQTVQNQFADKQATRDFVFARDGASFATSENEEAAKKLQEWAIEGLLHAGLQRHGLRPRVAAVRQGRGAVPDRRDLAHLRPRRRDGRQGRLLPHARPGGGAGTGVARRREPAVGHHPEVEERRRGGRLHRLPHEPGGGAGAGGDRTTCRR